MVAEWLAETKQDADAFNARAWGEHAIWGVAVAPVDGSGRLAYERARLAGHFGNRYLDAKSAREREP